MSILSSVCPWQFRAALRQAPDDVHAQANLAAAKHAMESANTAEIAAVARRRREEMLSRGEASSSVQRDQALESQPQPPQPRPIPARPSTAGPPKSHSDAHSDAAVRNGSDSTTDDDDDDDGDDDGNKESTP
jgi:hypothetical protein